MQNDFVHPHPGLENPMSINFDFVGKDFRSHRIDWALSNSFGFGGINTSVIIKKWGH
jgi:malonyl-ACP decarboxylase